MLTDEEVNQVIAIFGRQNQTIVAIEELAELQKELTKFLRADAECFPDESVGVKILEEIADVTIMLKQLMSIFEYTQSELDEMIEFKVIRLKKHINNVLGD